MEFCWALKSRGLVATELVKGLVFVSAELCAVSSQEPCKYQPVPHNLGMEWDGISVWKESYFWCFGSYSISRRSIAILNSCLRIFEGLLSISLLLLCSKNVHLIMK